MWGGLIGVNLSNYGMGTTYTIITSISVAVSLVTYILVPQEWGIVSGIRSITARIRNMFTKEQDSPPPEES